MAAKPIIDIMVPVRSLEASRDAIAELARCNYTYWPYKPEAMHWFCKPSPAHRTHHLHLVPYGSKLWLERLAFRDALRSNTEIAIEYAGLKRSLAVRFRHDREGYTNGKSRFVERVISGTSGET